MYFAVIFSFILSFQFIDVVAALGTAFRAPDVAIVGSMHVFCQCVEIFRYAIIFFFS
jgi:hypothetical protein